MYIYLIENILNNKKYIGQTIRKNPKYRWYEHRRKSLKENVVGSLHYDIKKYGKENFKFKIIDTCLDIISLNYLEKKYISEYDTFMNGYNKTTGGDRLYEHRLETRNNMSKNSVNSKPVLVYDSIGAFYDEFISANRASSEMNIDVRSVFRVLSGKRRKTKGFYFIWKDSNNYPKSIDISKRNHNKYNTKIYKYDSNGNLKESYASIYEAAEKNGVKLEYISRVLSGRRKYHLGFHYSISDNSDIKKVNRSVMMIDNCGNILEIYSSVSEASKKNKINASSISRVLHGHRGSIYGKKFVFSENK